MAPLQVVCAGYVDRMHRKENTEFDVQTDWKSADIIYSVHHDQFHILLSKQI